jgi:hypothetical protein
MARLVMTAVTMKRPWLELRVDIGLDSILKQPLCAGVGHIHLQELSCNASTCTCDF